MAKKTFKIGESAVGGIVKVDVTNDIMIQCCEWDTGQPILSGLFDLHQRTQLQLWLEERVTTAYYADKIIEYIYKN